MNPPVPPSFLSEEQIILFDRLADRVTRYRFGTPAVLFLESMRPMNFVGSQAMLFFSPMIHSFFTARDYDLLQQALERRETLGYLVELIEVKELAAAKLEREWRKTRRAERKARRIERNKHRHWLVKWWPW